VKKNQLTNKSIIKTFPFRSEKEKDGTYFVQNPGARVFKLNHVQHQFLTALAAKSNLLKAVKNVEEKTGQKISTLEAKLLVGRFVKCGLIKKIDDLQYSKKELEKNFFHPFKILARLFWLFSGLLFLSLLLFAVFKPSLIIPRNKDFFFSNSLFINLFSAVVMGTVLGFLHELSHALVGAAKGLKRISFSFGVRMYYLVFETSFRDIYLIKEKNRLPIYLAGIVFDLGVMGLISLMLWLNLIEIIIFTPLAVRWFKQIFLLEFLSVLWEFMFFIKTDVYFFLIDLFDIEDFKFKFSLQKKKDCRKNIFSLLLWLGKLFLSYQFFAYFLPIKINTFKAGFRLIREQSVIQQLDGLAALLIEVVYDLFFVYVLAKKIKEWVYVNIKSDDRNCPTN
jgi:hypothetical protein